MNFHIFEGDCLEVLKELDENSIDSIVTDPPYGLSFMNKKWDYDVPSVEIWKECLRVLKPGGHALIACGTRTQHRMVVNIEDAGFEIRDVISWFYGCLSEDTEILTEDGWEHYHKDILKNPILCYNKEKDTFQFEMPTKEYYYENKHPCYSIKSDSTDQIVSRNHRCIVEQAGRKIFKYAETLECQENIPFLESLSNLPETIPNIHKGTSIQKQVLLQKVCRKENNQKEKVTTREKTRKSKLLCLWERILQTKLSCKEMSSSLLFQKMQWNNQRTRMEKTCLKRQEKLETRVREGFNSENDRRNKSSLERWSNLFQKEGKLYWNKICEMSQRVFRNGKERWIYNGASTNSGSTFRETLKEDRSSASLGSQSREQQDRKSKTFSKQQGTQIIRSTRAEVKEIEYKGNVWCVEVPSGAFLARRNGKIFITGNSGFPKSLNIQKNLEKMGEKEAAENYSGWGTALKPACEFWTLARKPLSEKNIAENVLKWGTGGINIDGCRVEADWNTDPTKRGWQGRKLASKSNVSFVDNNKELSQPNPQGRFPANLILDEEAGKMLDSQSGNTGAHSVGKLNKEYNYNLKNQVPSDQPFDYGDTGGASRFFKNIKENTCINVSIVEKNLNQQESVEDFVLKLVAIRDSQEDSLLKNIVTPFMIEIQKQLKQQEKKNTEMIQNIGKKCEQELKHIIMEKLKNSPVNNVEIQKLINIMMIIQNLMNIDGFVGHVISNTMLTNMVLGEKVLRFNYCAKTSKSERNAGLESRTPQITSDGRAKSIDNPFLLAETERKNNHPTVKPLNLMKYLVKLITPPNGLVLDPFNGSGSTGCAAVQEGFQYLGIEREPEYVEISNKRIEYWANKKDEK